MHLVCYPVAESIARNAFGTPYIQHQRNLTILICLFVIFVVQVKHRVKSETEGYKYKGGKHINSGL